MPTTKHGFDDFPIRERFLSDHERLENVFEQLVAAFGANDRDGVADIWSTFDAQLMAHMAAEERFLISALFQDNPREARVILHEHERIRARLLELGAGIDLHVVNLATARVFVDELRAHARHEDQLLYAWADQRVASSDRESSIDALVDGAAKLTAKHRHSPMRSSEGAR